MILDVPCGGGVAFRGLRPGQRVRYVAGDLSPVMLRRARAEAKRRELDQIEFIEADVEALPFDDASFDLCVSYTGLHCFPDPAVAISEIARVLRPGGVLRGTMVIRRAGLRQDALVRLSQAAGVFGRAALARSWKGGSLTRACSTWARGATVRWPTFPPGAIPSRRSVTGDRARSSRTSNTQTSDSNSVAESSGSVQSLSTTSRTSSSTGSTACLAPATSLQMLRSIIRRFRSSTPARIGPDRTTGTSP